jgi:hypothetical protein
MFAANAYVIRHVIGAERLAELDSQRPLTGPALVGEIDGRPAAAISLADGRLVADPFQHTAALVAQLRMRARALSEHDRTPSLAARLRERLPDGRPVAPGYWF